MRRDRDLTRTVRRRLDLLTTPPGPGPGTGWVPSPDGVHEHGSVEVHEPRSTDGAAHPLTSPPAEPPPRVEPPQPLVEPPPLRVEPPAPDPVELPPAPVEPPSDPVEPRVEPPVPFPSTAQPAVVAWPPRQAAAGQGTRPPARTSAALRDAAETYAASHGAPLSRQPRRRVRWSVSWRLVLVAGAAVLLLAGGVVLRAASATPGEPVALPLPAPGGTPTPAASAGAPPVVVDVVGAVGVPGVVRLPAGSRVVDAVAAAGGAAADAEVGALNLARVLVDGEQIVVPGPGQAAAVTGAPAEPADDLVDLNTADEAALDALPGIGPVLAQRIVAHRDDGPYTSVDELGDVSGIGPTLLDRLRDLVRV